MSEPTRLERLQLDLDEVLLERDQLLAALEEADQQNTLLLKRVSKLQEKLDKLGAAK